jgi:hypothetical protein
VRSMERRGGGCIEIGCVEIGYMYPIEVGSTHTGVGIAHVKAIEALHRPTIFAVVFAVLHQAGRF